MEEQHIFEYDKVLSTVKNILHNNYIWEITTFPDYQYFNLSTETVEYSKEHVIITIRVSPHALFIVVNNHTKRIRDEYTLLFDTYTQYGDVIFDQLKDLILKTEAIAVGVSSLTKYIIHKLHRTELRDIHGYVFRIDKIHEDEILINGGNTIIDENMTIGLKIFRERIESISLTYRGRIRYRSVSVPKDADHIVRNILSIYRQWYLNPVDEWERV